MFSCMDVILMKLIKSRVSRAQSTVAERVDRMQGFLFAIFYPFHFDIQDLIAIFEKTLSKSRSLDE